MELDRAFLHTVFVGMREKEFAQAGWHAEVTQTLLANQFEMQEAYYRRHCSRARFDVVLRGTTSIGRLYHDWSGVEVRVIDIALLPEYRGAGVGTCLMHALVAEAAHCAMPMQLHVEFDNPVRPLYRRLGFEQIGENGPYALMRREAQPFDGELLLSLAALTIEKA